MKRARLTAATPLLLPFVPPPCRPPPPRHAIELYVLLPVLVKPAARHWKSGDKLGCGGSFGGGGGGGSSRGASLRAQVNVYIVPALHYHRNHAFVRLLWRVLYDGQACEGCVI